MRKKTVVFLQGVSVVLLSVACMLWFGRQDTRNSLRKMQKECSAISSRNSTIELSAPNSVRLKQGNTMMNLGGKLNMSGAQIKL